MKHVFLLGNPRSGTSLLRLMLAQHQSIIAPPECGFSHWWLERYGGWTAADNSEEHISAFLDDLFTSKKIHTWELNRETLFKQIKTRHPKSYSELVDCVYLCYGQKTAGAANIIIDKNNYYIHHLHDLPRIWPDTYYLQIVRDGRDVACSYLDVHQLQTNSPYKPQLPTSIESIATEWNTNNQKILSFLDRAGRDRYFIIRYEDLILDTERTLKDICSFLQIAYSENMLSYYEQSSSFSREPKETLDWKKKTLEKPDSARICRYKTDLTTDQIEQFNRLAFQTLKQFDYV